MSTTTTNLGLFKYNIDTDSHLAFNINQALNDNWDIIDEFAASGGTGISKNIGEIVTSTIPLTDAGLHLLDGSLINGSGSYSSFVNYIAGLVNVYPDCFTTESNWQSSVSSYGVCGKFVYNSINNTVRLPKYSNKIYTSDFENNAPVVGTGMVLGLTNGTGTAGFAAGTYAVADPTAYGEDASTKGASNTRLQGLIGVTTDPSKSGLIAQLSNITTSLEGYYYIVIANSTKTDIEVDIDEIATDLNGKADTDLTNTTPAISFATAMDNAGIRTVVETYQKGTSWYRVYSDGWCEQGGCYSYSSLLPDTDYQVSLLKSYKNTSYNIITTLRNNNGNAGFVNVDNSKGIAKKYFFMRIVHKASFPCSPLGVFWRTCGYIS